MSRVSKYEKARLKAIKANRRVEQSKKEKLLESAVYIADWEALAAFPNLSATHELVVDLTMCSGRIYPRSPEALQKQGHIYLSTHTFYGSQHEGSTHLLQKCGFNVILANWDA